jgi:MFS superfamily sulfate permease-like transporter
VGADVAASLVVFLVALPLCMGVAIASGVPVELGLLTGIIGGIVAGAMPGSTLVVSGPAAGLTVLVFDVVREHGVAALGIVVLLAGGLQIVLGLARMGQWFRAIALPVVHGMLAGIGVIIIASQIYTLVDDSPRGDGLSNLAHLPEALEEGFIASGPHHVAALLGLATLAVLVAWRYLPARVRRVPGSLVAVAGATAAAALLDLPVHRVELSPNLLGAVRLPSLEVLASPTSGALDTGLLLAAVTFALVASAESLLSATAVDRMHDGPRTDYNRELLAQGTGNLVAGFVGALPMTGVIVRSATNVNAGARTRLSAVLHGVWLLAAVLLAPGVLGLIPTAALAAVLVHAGIKLLEPSAVRSMWRTNRADVAVYAATVVGIVVTDLLEGVVIGLALALVKLVWETSRLEVEVTAAPDGTQVVDLRGTATFVRLPKLAAALEAIPAGADVRVEVARLGLIDAACRELLATWRHQHEARGGHVVVAGTPGLGDAAPAAAEAPAEPGHERVPVGGRSA